MAWTDTHSDVAISLTGKMPDCSGNMFHCDAPAYSGECLSVNNGEALYTLRSGWEKRKISLSISQFKRAGRSFRRSIRPAPLPVMPMPGPCFFGQFSRLRL